MLPAFEGDGDLAELGHAAAEGGAVFILHAADLGEHRFDTADFTDPAPGNLRVDHVLPARGLTVRGAGVLWPAPGDPLSAAVAAAP